MSPTYFTRLIGRTRVIIDPSNAVVAFITGAGLVVRAALANMPATINAVKRFGAAQSLPDSAFYSRLNSSLL